MHTSIAKPVRLREDLVTPLRDECATRVKEMDALDLYKVVLNVNNFLKQAREEQELLEGGGQVRAIYSDSTLAHSARSTRRRR